MTTRPAITTPMVDAYTRAHDATLREHAPTTQGALVTAHRAAVRAGLEAALADVLSTGTVPVEAHQWSVRYPDGFVDGGRFGEAGARQRAAELGGVVVYRAVGPWQVAA